MAKPRDARASEQAATLSSGVSVSSETSTGLSSAEAAKRLEHYGRNVIDTAKSRMLALQLLLRFGNPLSLLLLAASAVSFVTGDDTSGLIIAGIVLLSVTLDFAQEHRAGRAAEKLKQAARVRASVLRESQVLEVPSDEVVPGDVVLLAAGDLVPADGRLLEAHDLFVNQALLTGEPYPVEKHVAVTDQLNEQLDARTGSVFMGTTVLSGSGRALIERTGTQTAVGQIGLSLTRPTPPTAFEIGTRQFGMLILRLAFVMVLFVLLVDTLRGEPWLQSFLFAVALAVGLTPELLPMVVSVTLARGAVHMSRNKVLVKRLSAIHDLGAMDVLCTDKTGTLTEANIRLEKHLSPLGADSAHVLLLLYLNSRFESGLRSPLDEAVLRHEELDIRGWSKLDELPFDFERRRVSVLVERDSDHLLIVKGAIEDILELSTHVEQDDGELALLNELTRRGLTARAEELAQDGFRVLGVAYKREAADCKHVIITDETALTFAGFAAFEDPPKASARAALSALTDSGVTPVIVSGDNELVTMHLCKALDIPVRGVLLGRELAKLDDAALGARVEQVNLFCRVNPLQKRRIIEALRQRGHVVGYLGDGINDAPSLHAADVGISVDSAVDVAKDAADLILMEHSLEALREGVIEGRRTLGNILKYIMMGTSSNFGNMFSMAGAAMFLPFLPMLPVQILLNNLMYDVSEIPIPSDAVDAEFLQHPHRLSMHFIRRFMLIVGPISSLFDFVTFFGLWRLFGGDEALFHSGWFVESLATQVLVIFVIRTRVRPWQSKPSLALSLTSLAVVLCALLLPQLAWAARIGFAPLPAAFYLLLGVLVAAYLVVVEHVKNWFYRRYAADV